MTAAVVAGKQIQETKTCKIEQLGCYDSHSRTLGDSIVYGASDGDFLENIAKNSYMTPEFCSYLCLGAFGAEFKYSGVEGVSGEQCRCGTDEVKAKDKLDIEKCGAPCPNGSEGEICGGDWAILVQTISCEDDDVEGVVKAAAEEKTFVYKYEGETKIIPFSPRTLIQRDEGEYVASRENGNEERTTETRSERWKR